MKHINFLLSAAIILSVLLSSCSNVKYIPPYEGWLGKSIGRSDIALWVGRDPFSLVVMKKPGVTQDEFMRWVNKIIDNGNTGKIKSACASCDSTLLLLDGEGPESMVHAETSSGSGTKKVVDLTGDNAYGFFSVNYYMYLPEIFDLREAKNFDSLAVMKASLSGPLVKVGVLDSGIDPDLAEAFTKPVVSPCMPGAFMGWNMIDQSNRTNDDYKQRSGSSFKHGNPVSKFIIKNTQHNNAAIPDILPVKTHNAEGIGNMWQLLCGMAYAAKSGSQIVNASCGMYAFESEQVEFLCTFIESYLTSKGILLVAAAGNKVQKWQDSVAVLQGFGLGFSADDWRNLDKVPFYPAAFSNDLSNVISVTTVSDKAPYMVSPNQNYSSTRVDIGVRCDTVNNSSVDKHYIFFEPVTKTPRVGSSFAAPQVAGMLAANLQRLGGLTPGAPVDKSALLNSLATLGLIKPYSSLTNKIRNGYLLSQ